MNILWQKEKTLIMSNFTFYHNVFQKLSALDASKIICKWARGNQMFTSSQMDSQTKCWSYQLSLFYERSSSQIKGFIFFAGKRFKNFSIAVIKYA